MAYKTPLELMEEQYGVQSKTKAGEAGLRGVFKNLQRGASVLGEQIAGGQEAADQRRMQIKEEIARNNFGMTLGQLQERSQMPMTFSRMDEGRDNATPPAIGEVGYQPNRGITSTQTAYDGTQLPSLTSDQTNQQFQERGTGISVSGRELSRDELSRNTSGQPSLQAGQVWSPKYGLENAGAQADRNRKAEQNKQDRTLRQLESFRGALAGAGARTGEPTAAEKAFTREQTKIAAMPDGEAKYKAQARLEQKQDAYNINSANKTIEQKRAAYEATINRMTQTGMMDKQMAAQAKAQAKKDEIAEKEATTNRIKAYADYNRVAASIAEAEAKGVQVSQEMRQQAADAQLGAIVGVAGKENITKYKNEVISNVGALASQMGGDYAEKAAALQGDDEQSVAARNDFLQKYSILKQEQGSTPFRTMQKIFDNPTATLPELLEMK